MTTSPSDEPGDKELSKPPSPKPDTGNGSPPTSKIGEWMLCPGSNSIDCMRSR